MHKMLDEMKHDLMKAESGNKAACQRVRTCSIRFEKLSKKFRKESVKAEKSGTMKKAKKATKKKPAKKATKKKVAKKATRKVATKRRTTARSTKTKRKTARRR